MYQYINDKTEKEETVHFLGQELQEAPRRVCTIGSGSGNWLQEPKSPKSPQEQEGLAWKHWYRMFICVSTRVCIYIYVRTCILY